MLVWGGVMQDEQSEVMRAGVRARVTRLAGTVRVGTRRWSPSVVLGMLCAGAFAPLLMATGGDAALISAGLGAVGSVGGGVLAEVMMSGVEHLREKDGEPASAEEVQTVLEQRIQQVLEAGGEEAERLRGEIAGVLLDVGAVGAALDAAVRTGDRLVQEQLAVGFAEMGEQFSEFGFVLADLRDGLRLIQDGVNEQSGRSRLATDLLYQQGTDIRSLLDLVSVLESRSRASSPDAAGSGPSWAGGCPYRGLVPFTEADAHVFYGRQRDTARLVSTLAAHLAGSALVVVTGASGAGKTSLLRAGLLPAIGRGGLSESARDWPRRLIEETTRSPLSQLAVLLATMAGLDVTGVLHSLAAAPEQAHLLVRQAVEADADRRGLDPVAAANCRLLLVIDQFEQIFTVTGGADEGAAASERAAFIAALHAAATTPCGGGGVPAALVVIAVRGDFTDRCANYPALATALEDSQFVVGPMTETDLRLAITGPASAAGLDLEAGLADTILSELRSGGGYDAGALPLVSQIMLAIWEHRDGGRLTLRGYAQTNGVVDAVASSAEAAYASLGQAAQHLVRQVFQQLVSVSATGELARRPASRADFHGVRDTQQGSEIGQVLDAFARQRLIVIDAATVQIGHDILLAAWPRLRAWLEPDLTGHALRSQLRDAADEWARHDHASAYLYRGEHLAAVTQARSRWDASPERYPALTETSARFLHASNAAQTRGARIRRALFIAMASLLVIATIASVVAQRNSGIAASARDNAIQQLDGATSGQLATQSELIGDDDPVIARLLAVAAWRIDHRSADADYAILDASMLPGVRVLPAVGSTVYAVAYSPDGKTLASGEGDGTIRLWNVSTGQQIGKALTGHAGKASSVAFSPGGTLLAAGYSDGTIQLWDVATGRPAGAPITCGKGAVNTVAFGPGGKILASGSDDDAVQLWNVATGLQIGHTFTAQAGQVSAVAFSPDGKILASGNQDGTIRLWDVATGQQIRGPLTSGAGPVNSVAFNPDGQTIASGSNGTAQLWNTATGQLIKNLPDGDEKPVDSVAFSPDGKILASGSNDETIRLWDVQDGQQTGPSLTGHTGWVKTVAFSPDGTTLASGSTDQTIRLWNAASGQPMTSLLTGDAEPVNSVTFSPDGKILASGGADGTIRLWNAAAGRPAGKPLNGRAGAVSSVAFSPDGKTLAAGYADGTVLLWNAASGKPIGRPLASDGGPVSSVAFSSDGKILASGNTGGTIQLWDATTGQPIEEPITADSGTVSSLAFSPGSEILASGNADNTIQLWNVDTRRQVRAALTGSSYAITSVAFSPDGKKLASSSVDYTIRLWYVATGQQIGNPLNGGTEAVSSVAFSPSGAILASGGTDGTVRLWNAATGQQIGAPFTGQAGSVNSVAFSPDGDILASGNANGTVQLWNIAKLQDAVPYLCASAGRSLTRTEWAQYVLTGLAYQNVCPR
jgi:WD40 repeat protein